MGARYCAWCGAPLPAPLWSGDRPLGLDVGEENTPLRVECRQCGGENDASFAHCVHCGVRLDGEGAGAVPTPGDVARAAGLVSEAREEFLLGRREAAQARCREALALNARNAEAHALLAEIAHAEGRVGAALQEMTAALRYDPHNADYEERLRALRDEQDRALKPLLRGLDEPPRPLHPSPAGRPVRRPLRREVAWPRMGRLPEWAKAAILIGAAVLLVAGVPMLTAGVLWVLGLVLGVLITIFVFQDARRLGYPPSVAGLWAAMVCLATFVGARFFGGTAGLVALLAYLLITRARR